MKRDPKSPVPVYHRIESLIELARFADAKQEFDTLSAQLRTAAVKPLLELWKKRKSKN